MEHTKYLQSVSKEGEIMILKEKKVHVQASILRCFWVWEPPRGHPGNHAEIETPKNINEHFSALFFWNIFMTGVVLFW